MTSGLDEAGSTTFREAMRTVAQPVALLGCGSPDGVDAACVVNTVFPVSMAPPSLGVSLSRESHTCASLAHSGRFWISFFEEGEEQQMLAVAQADRHDRPTVAGLPDDHGRPILDNDSSAFECEVFETVEAIDHIVFLGFVVQVVRVGDVRCLSA